MSSANSIDTDILICGGGAPGLTLAVLLAQIGAAVVLIERGPLVPGATVDASRTAALMQGSVNIVRQCGVWAELAPKVNPLRTLRIVDDAGPAPVTADFMASELGLDAFGYNTPNHALVAALADHAATLPGLTLLPGVMFQGFGGGDSAKLEARTSGPAIRARLCVAADGRRSAVREAAGIAAETHEYGQSAITCVVSHTQPHNDISTEFHRAGGPFTLVPLPGQTSSVVWVDSTAATDGHIRLKKPAFVQALQDRSRNLLGRLSLESDPVSYPLIGLRAQRLTAPRVALVAEAAHVLHPLGAQGLNLSLRDVGLLAEIIVDTMRLGGDPGGTTALARYEAARRRDVTLRARGTDGLNAFVRSDGGFTQVLRRTGLRTVSGIGPLRQLLMREGLAPGEDSRLARGEAL